MKVNCPECSQHFSVPDKAIGPKGRKLRCSKCGHHWHQMLVEEAPKKKAAPKKPAKQPAAQENEESAPEEEEVVPFVAPESPDGVVEVVEESDDVEPVVRSA